jgi:hypothetical protein
MCDVRQTLYRKFWKITFPSIRSRPSFCPSINLSCPIYRGSSSFKFHPLFTVKQTIRRISSARNASKLIAASTREQLLSKWWVNLGASSVLTWKRYLFWTHFLNQYLFMMKTVFYWRRSALCYRSWRKRSSSSHLHSVKGNIESEQCWKIFHWSFGTIIMTFSMRSLYQQLLFARIYRLTSIFSSTSTAGSPLTKLVHSIFGIYSRKNLRSTWNANTILESMIFVRFLL